MIAKVENVIDIVRSCISDGNYIYSKHALLRRSERSISDGDVRHALLQGWHEKKKDKWIDDYDNWNYSIRGKSLESDNLRIVVNLDEYEKHGIIIITVINLDN